MDTLIKDVIAINGELINLGTASFKQNGVVFLEFVDHMKDPYGWQAWFNKKIKDHHIEKVEVEGCTLKVFLSKTGIQEDLGVQEVVQILKNI